MSDENHCADCCCARSWKALGITTYTGKSIPEHIEALTDERDRYREALEKRPTVDFRGDGAWVNFVAKGREASINLVNLANMHGEKSIICRAILDWIAERTPLADPAQLICAKCGANRYHEPCKGSVYDCPIIGTTSETKVERKSTYRMVEDAISAAKDPDHKWEAGKALPRGSYQSDVDYE